jgi:L-alanine-DL-glutamate epimerase-like enolase superfamily enzyme
LSIPNFLILEFFEPDEAVFQEIVVGGLRRDAEAVLPIDAPGLGVKIDDAFLAKHKFNPQKTQEMERRVFDTVR